MTYITADIIAFYITLGVNISFAGLFLYHVFKHKPNKSLMLLCGGLSIFMALSHVLTSYKSSLDQATMVYYNLVVNWYLIHMTLAGALVGSIYGLHRVFTLKLHPSVRYVFFAMLFSMGLNGAMHVDLMMLGNDDTHWLYTLYSLGENILMLFVFCSVLVARRWSEVFAWFRAAHSGAQWSEVEALNQKQLQSMAEEFEAAHQNTHQFVAKWRAIWRFVSFVLFNSKEQKQQRCRRNELTAEKLLLEYQDLVRLPGNERVDRFIRWRDDVADFQQRREVERQ